MNSIINLSVQQLNKAIGLKTKIESLQNQLARIFGSPTPTKSVAHVAPKKKWTMSAAARAKISAAAKKRWAKVKGTKTPAKAAVKTAKPAKKKFTMSKAAKAKLSAMAKARWAKVKAAGKSKL
jgi:hypothetical protein